MLLISSVTFVNCTVRLLLVFLLVEGGAAGVLAGGDGGAAAGVLAGGGGSVAGVLAGGGGGAAAGVFAGGGGGAAAAGVLAGVDILLVSLFHFGKRR